MQRLKITDPTVGRQVSAAAGCLAGIVLASVSRVKWWISTVNITLNVFGRILLGSIHGQKQTDKVDGQKMELETSSGKREI